MVVTIIFILFLGSIIWGAIENPLETLISRLIEVVISAFLGAFIIWLLMALFGFGELWWTGAILGAGYCVFCWIFRKRNILVATWFTR